MENGHFPPWRRKERSRVKVNNSVFSYDLSKKREGS